jgi:hypothetical protein
MNQKEELISNFDMLSDYHKQEVISFVEYLVWKENRDIEKLVSKIANSSIEYLQELKQ